MSEKVDMKEGRSLIILDEIQDCTNAYSALKPLSFDKRFDVIALGSFLGVNLDDDDERISPLGYVDIIRMHPMDFEEYLWAMGIKKELISEVSDNIRSETEVQEYFNRAMIEHYRRFLVIGGMPEAVRTYAETQDYVKVSAVLDNIITVLKKDTGRYSRKAGRAKINSCLDSIPEQLSRENKRFLYRDVEKKKNTGRRVYGNSIEWLNDSGLAIGCKNLSEPMMPLSERASEDSFKLYLADTGILVHLMKDLDPSSVALNDPFVNHGAIMENAVLSDLVKNGYTPYYYAKKNSTLEINFVVDMKGKVALIEVKSGQNKRAKSLKTMMSERRSDRIGLKVIEGNVLHEDNGIVHIPLYAMSMIEPKKVDNIPPATDADEINARFDEYMNHRHETGE